MSRRQIYIVYNSYTRSVWKHLFFMKKEQALITVKDFYPHLKWVKKGNDCIYTKPLGSFRIFTLKEFTKRSDIPLTEYSQWVKSLEDE